MLFIEDLGRTFGVARDAIKAFVELFYYAGKDIHYQSGDIILRENEAPDTVVLVKSGVIKCQILNEEGDQVFIRTLPKHTVYGYTHALLGTHYLQTLVADGDVVVSKMSAEKYRLALQNNNELMMAALRLTTANLVEVQLYSKEYMNNAPIDILRSFLLAEAMLHSEQHQNIVTLRFDKTELSSRLKVTRPTLGKLLKTLEEEGAIEQGYKTVTVNKDLLFAA